MAREGWRRWWGNVGNETLYTHHWRIARHQNNFCRYIAYTQKSCLQDDGKKSHIQDSVTNTRKSHSCCRSWHEIHCYFNRGIASDRLQEILGCCCCSNQRHYSLLPWWSSTLLSAEKTTDGPILKVAKKSNTVDDGNTVAKCFIFKDNIPKKLVSNREV